MALKKKVKNLEDVPEAFRTEYVKKGEEFVLNTETDPEEKDAKAKLSEFRDNNIKLQKQLDELTQKMEKFKDVDPEQWEEAKKALESVQSEQEKELIRSGRIDELVARRLENARSAWEKKERDLATRNQALETENKDLGGKLSQRIIDTEVADMISALGVSVRKNALVDVKNRARQTWTVDKNGDLIAEGLYNETDGKPMTFIEWGRKLVQEAPHFFEAGGGSGAGGGNRKRRNEAEDRKTIDGADPLAIGKNLDAIASGRANVRFQGATIGGDNTSNGDNE